jgi:hypothetical protein
LSYNIPEKFFRFILILFFKKVRYCDHWVNVSPAEWPRKKDGHKKTPRSLRINLVRKDGTRVSINKKKNSNKLENEYLKITSKVNIAVGRVLKAAHNTLPKSF